MMSGQSPQCSLYHLCHSQVRYSGQSGPECAGTEFLGPVAMLPLKASRKEQFLGTTNCLGLFCSYSITSSCHSAVLLSYANEIKASSLFSLMIMEAVMVVVTVVVVVVVDCW